MPNAIVLKEAYNKTYPISLQRWHVKFIITCPIILPVQQHAYTFKTVLLYRCNPQGTSDFIFGVPFFDCIFKPLNSHILYTGKSLLP